MTRYRKITPQDLDEDYRDTVEAVSQAAQRGCLPPRCADSLPNFLGTLRRVRGSAFYRTPPSGPPLDLATEREIRNLDQELRHVRLRCRAALTSCKSGPQHNSRISVGAKRELREHPWLSAPQARHVAQDHLDEDPQYYPPRGNPNDPTEHYRTFHGVDPNRVLEGNVWVPGELELLGVGKDVGYGILDRRSQKEGWFVHDFGPGVKVYRRASKSGPVHRRYQRFPRRLMILGRWLGFTLDDHGQLRETKAPTRSQYFLAVTPDRRTLAVVSRRGVEYVMAGGHMRVEDWIRD